MKQSERATIGGTGGRRLHAKHGFLLVISLVAFIVLITLGLLTMRLAVYGTTLSSQQSELAQALALAEAGADMGEAYLRAQASPPQATLNYPATGSITLATGTCSAVITPFTNPYDPWTKDYTITGYGTSKRFGKTRKVIMQCSPRSFSMYGYFEDTGLSNNWWVSKISTFDGPFHSNGTVQISWDSTSTTNDVIFRGTASSAKSSVTWYNNKAPSTTAQWNTVLSGGQAALTLGADTIPFPTVATEQRDAAWGSSSGAPTTQATADCYVQNGAGIYINSQDKPCDITFSVDGSGNQVLTIHHQIYQSSTWKDKYTEVTVNLVANQTSTRTKITSTGTWTTPTVTTGVPNGVLYSTGSISGVSGTMAKSYVTGNQIVRANNWTIGTDYSSTGQKSITITNNVKYIHHPDYVHYSATDPYNLEVPALGVLGYQIWVNDSADYVSGVKDDLYMDGVYMGLGNLSNGSIRVKDIDLSHLRGNLYIYGGSVVKTAAILGQFTGTNTLQYGYSEHYSYDARMASGPLVAFPRTNQYNILSWQSR